MKVNGKDYPIYHGKKMFETTNQLSIVTTVCLSTWCNGILHHLHLCSLCVVPHSFACGYTDVFFTRSKPATHSELATAQPTGLDPVLYSRSLLAMVVSQNPGTRMVTKIAGSWMLILPNMVIIGFDPSPYHFTVLCQALRRAKGPSHTKPDLHFFCTS